MGVCLSLHAGSMMEYGVSSMAPQSEMGASSLERLAEEKFSRALALKPNSFNTLVRWALALQQRLLRSYVASDALELLGEIGSKYHQALTLKARESWVLIQWARAFDFVLDAFLRPKHVEFSDIHPQLEAFFDVYRQTATKSSYIRCKIEFFVLFAYIVILADVSLKPIVAFCLVGDDHVDRESFVLLSELAGVPEPDFIKTDSPDASVASTASTTKNQVSQDKKPSSTSKKHHRRAMVSTKSRPVSDTVREEAKQTLHHIELLIKSRKEQAQNNAKRAVEVIKALPLKATKEFDRSQLTLSEVAADIDIFLNCLYFLVDAETAKDSVFELQKKNKRVPYAAKRKRYTPEDMKRLAKVENPKSIFRHRVPIGSGCDLFSLPLCIMIR